MGGGKGGGGKGGGGKGGGNEPSFESECLKLGRALAEAAKLPGIIFCMSRKRCVEGAHALAALSLVGGRAARKPSEEGEAYEAWVKAEEKRKGVELATSKALDVRAV